MGCIVISLFFAKFWKKTRDTLFAYFSLAFALLALERVLQVEIGEAAMAHTPWIFGTRLVAFSLLIIAIGNKNRSR